MLGTPAQKAEGIDDGARWKVGDSTRGRPVTGRDTAPPLIFELAGGAALSVWGADRATARRVEVLMDPYRPVSASGGASGLALEQAPAGAAPRLIDVHGPAGDELVTGSDGESVYLIQDGRWCSLPDPDGRLRFQPGFPIWQLFRSVVRPALMLALIDRGAACVHSASVELDGAAVVVSGWSETGKTETALAFLEEGARFISDKWSVLSPDRTVGTFPISVGIRRWVLRYLPRLRAALPRTARVQLQAAGALAGLTAPVRRRGLPGRLGSLAISSTERVIALADRAALSPSEVAAAYGHGVRPDAPVPLRALVILTTVAANAEPVALRTDPEWASRRLARSAAYERRGLDELLARSRYAFPDRPDPEDEPAEIREERLLIAALADRPVIEARAPFPTDPRRVAESIARLL